MNVTIDPCEDFYEFACGSWAEKNPRPKHEASWSQWEPVLYKVDENLHQILRDETNGPKNAPINIARKMYKSCLQNTNETENLKEVLKLIGNWPILSQFDQKQFSFEDVAKINAKLNVFPFCKIHVSRDLFNTDTFILYLDYPQLSFPKYILENPQIYVSQINAYKKLIKESVEKIYFLQKIPQRNIEREVEQIVEFEIKLTQIMSHNYLEDVTKLYKKMTINELQIWSDLLTSKKLDWLRILRHFDASFDTQTIIIVKDLLYFLRMLKMLDEVETPIISNYVGWTLFNYFAKDLSQNFDVIYFKVEQQLFGIETTTSRKTKCIISINKYMNVVISHEYIKNYVSDVLKKDVTILVKNIKNTLLEKLKEFDWLDDFTKIQAMEKALNIDYVVAYPDFLKNQTFIEEYYKNFFLDDNYIRNIILWNKFDRNKEFDKIILQNELKLKSVADVNAYYNILQNLIILPSGILQYPFYEVNRINAINYGAIGTLIGHELSHAFDNTGRQADKSGNIKQWWTPESLSKYSANIRCLEQHYNNFFKLKKIYYKMDENIADIIGLKLSYAAFKKKLQGLQLPGLGFNEEQLFFISFANQWCENTTPQNTLNQLFDDEHTPNKVRVNAALSNNKEFLNVFKCTPHNGMAPPTVCTL